MSGSGAQKRSQALAVRVSILAETMTHRAIAEMVGKRPEQIKGLVELGQRLRSQFAKGEPAISNASGGKP